MTIATENPRVTELRQAAANSYAEIIALVDGELAGLSAEKLYQAPAEGEWSLMESLAHINEFMPYWANEVNKLVAQPGQAFGRVMSDPARNQALKDHGHDSLEQARSALPTNYAPLEQTLARLQDSDLALTGVHSKFGERSLEWFIEEFITNHLANHLRQLRECLAVVRG